MSVYTPVSTAELELFLGRYAIGPLVSYCGIEKGITNSNFWLETESGHYVLTLYELHQPPALEYILGLQHHLAARGVACATPVIDKQQRYYSTLNNRPATISNRVRGKVCQKLSTLHCALIGSELAKFHLVGKSFSKKRSNPCGKQWRLSTYQKLLPVMAPTDQQLVKEEFQAYQQLENVKLPGGSTHSDLFHDNCLFAGKKFGGIIDFDYACNEALLYDLAITLNDCCIQVNGEPDSNLIQAFINAYDLLRPLQVIERDYLSLMLRLAATRFWLSRLHDTHFPSTGDIAFKKDPDEFKNILLLRRSIALKP